MSLKRDRVCPQCESRKLWHIERVSVFPNMPMPVAMEARFAGPRPKGSFQAHICAACGFTEWYATGLDELKPDPGAGVYYIDDEPKVGLR